MNFKYISLAALALFPASAFAGVSLNSAGATFPAPLYQRWFGDYSQATGNRVNYQSVGSGAGVRQFVAGTVDFAASDEPIKQSEAAKVKRKVVQFPVVGGTIAVAYNKPGCTLKLTQKQTADIFQGKVTNWAKLGCSSGPIAVVHRSDGSGTTFAFTSSLSDFSGDWKVKVGAGKAVSWPVGIGAKGNEGVAATVKNTPGAIGYTAVAFVKENKLQSAAIQNKAGNFTLPNLKGGQSALLSIRLDSNLAGEDSNPAGANSYPISTLTWVLAYEKGNGAKAGVIRDALRYMLSPGAQSKADDLGYVPLKEGILKQARQAINRISP